MDIGRKSDEINQESQGIRRNQNELTRNQKESEEISKKSEEITGNQKKSEGTRRNQGKSGGKSKESREIGRNQKGIRGNQTESNEIRRTRRGIEGDIGGITGNQISKGRKCDWLPYLEEESPRSTGSRPFRVQGIRGLRALGRISLKPWNQIPKKIRGNGETFFHLISMPKLAIPIQLIPK